MPIQRMVVVLGLLAVLGFEPLRAADKPAKKTAPTVAEALKVFDPAAWPILEADETDFIRRVGGFTYYAKGDPKSAFAFYQKEFAKQKWKELPNTYVSDMSCNGTFAKEGYYLSLSTIPVGDKGQVMVSFHNHGKVDLKALPVPKGVKPFYSLPIVEAYLTEQPKDETAAAVTKLLVAQGWEPYGTAGDQLFFRQNATRLSANVATAPAQNNQTAITFSAEQLSAEIPAPAKTYQLQYSDSTTFLMFDYDAEPVETAFASIPTFYEKALGGAGWKATTEQPIVTKGRHMLIYRNPAKDMLTLEMFEFDGRLRVEVKHQTAAEVEAIDAAIDAKIAERKKKEEEDAKKPKPGKGKLSVTLPADAKDIEAEASELKFTLGAGKSKPFVESLRKKLKGDGWKETTATLEAMFGLVLLEKGDQDVTLRYVETGVFPAEVTISATGVELEQAKAKK